MFSPLPSLCVSRVPSFFNGEVLCLATHQSAKMPSHALLRIDATPGIRWNYDCEPVSELVGVVCGVK